MIAYVYRIKRRRNGKVISSRIWRARIKLDGQGKPLDISLRCADKQTAEQKLRERIRDVERTAVGLLAPTAQRETFEKELQKLADEYVADLKALGRSADHVRHVDNRLGRLMKECQWKNLRDVTVDSFLRWRSQQTYSPKTINEYHAVLSALFTWLRKQNRAAVNPFEVVTKVDMRGKETFHRRALSDDEACRLLAGERRLLYLLVLHTGLRRGEINALRWGHLNLDNPNPFYALPAKSSKNRKEQPRPLHPELVAELKQLKTTCGASANAALFPDGVPPMDVIRADFAAANIPAVDERGYRLDFHALRTSYITRLQRSGVSPREAMELARHSDMRLTMKVYTDVGQLPLAATVRQLPGFSTSGNDTQRDTQKLFPARPVMSPAVLGLKAIKADKTIEHIGENHCPSPLVTLSPKIESGGERGIRTPGSV